MGRATNTGIVGPDQHFAKPPEFSLAAVQIPTDQSFQVMLNIGMIHIGGYDTVCFSDITLAIISIIMNQ